jgi:hypothetical protein
MVYLPMKKITPEGLSFGIFETNYVVFLEHLKILVDYQNSWKRPGHQIKALAELHNLSIDLRDVTRHGGAFGIGLSDAPCSPDEHELEGQANPRDELLRCNFVTPIPSHVDVCRVHGNEESYCE